MKYRMLTGEELKVLEDDLKSFLIVNGVDDDSWKEINNSDPDKAIELVELFSDTVLQKVYEKIFYLELLTIESFFVFSFNSKTMDLIAVQRKKGSEIDLSNPENVQHALQFDIQELDFYKSSKDYDENKETAVHELIQKGCVPSTKELFQTMKQFITL